MRVFMDANVLFAAAISPEGRSAALFAFAKRKVCTLLASMHAITEVRRNLEGRYPDALIRFEQLVHDLTIVPEASPSRVIWARQQGLPDEDAPIFAAAIEAGAAVLVTGDRRHFGNLFGRTFEGMRVLRLGPTLGLLLDQRAKT